MNNYEKALLSMYEKAGLRTIQKEDDLTNSICSECKLDSKIISEHNNADFCGPIGAWVVGNHFYENPYQILFVGKTARGCPGFDDKCCYNTFDDSRMCLWQKSWAYWSYTKNICQKVFDNDSIENIAFTNIVKCNISYTIDRTTDYMKECCISRLKIIKKEILIIKPNIIIFYTGKDYDAYIKDAFDDFIETRNDYCMIGRKSMPWLEATARLDSLRIKILRIGHPERMKKKDYTDKVSEWISSCLLI